MLRQAKGQRPAGCSVADDSRGTSHEPFAAHGDDIDRVAAVRGILDSGPVAPNDPRP